MTSSGMTSSGMAGPVMAGRTMAGGTMSGAGMSRPGVAGARLSWSVARCGALSPAALCLSTLSLGVARCDLRVGAS